jgi:hypothetical protein
MQRAYFIYGTVVCLLFAYASHRGYGLYQAIATGKWGPTARSYHK